MTTRELAAQVKKTLDAQQAYFKKKNSGLGALSELEECKRLEGALRKTVKSVLDDRGPGLFDGGVA